MNIQQIDEKAVFNAARRITDTAARDEYLAQACGDDQTALDHIRELLQIHEQGQSFLESPAAQLTPTADPAPIAERPGTVIGPYKLLQQIGEGGMGVVFMAEQERPIQRSVALKIIKPGMDTRQVIARFEAERQALAMMDHPNIAKVLDAGTTDTGRPYFVMELVKGVPITKYCDDRRLTVRQRLELFRPVCDAVQHAHQKGIIHRDLKPTNVLVAEYDNRAVPKVIDFGVAKATAQKLTERTMFTEFGQVIGTVEYMSPEQAKFNQLDIDTRSDIYSLGVLLYELLTGSTPFDRQRLRNAAFDEVLRIIREEEPPKPSTRLSSLSLGESAGVGVPSSLASIAANRHCEPASLRKDVRDELDWIVMKCLEKDRNRRYVTASGLAIDIERYLRDEPIDACPPSGWYQLRRFIRRNKVPVVATLLVACTMLIGIATTTWQALRATQAQRRAEAVAIRETELRHQAEIREKISTAGSFWDAGEFEKADALVREIRDTSIERNADATVSLLRLLAHWHAGEKRWRESAEYYNYLLFGPAMRTIEANDKQYKSNINLASRRFQTMSDMAYLEFATLLVELGDTASYEKLRNLAIDRYGHKYESDIDERMLYTCLLLPIHEEQMDTICRWAEFTKTGRTSFIYGSLALFEFRRGRDDVALEWCRRGLTVVTRHQAGMVARLHLLSAMALTRLNQRERAKVELAQCVELIETKFAGKLGVGNYGGNLWADWLLNRILLRECQNLISAALLSDEVSKSKAAERAAAEQKKWDTASVRARQELLSEIPEQGDAFTLSRIAWRLVTDPDVRLRDPQLALALAQQARRLAPTEAFNWTTLGAAQFRNGNLEEALDTLGRSMELSSGGSANGSFFLAMTQWNLGDKVEARKWYIQSVEWMNKNDPIDDELSRFRAEAAKLLGISEPAKTPDAATRP